MMKLNEFLSQHAIFTVNELDRFLSGDIDINYIGALDREEMLQDRPKIEQAAQAVFSREGLTIKRVPNEHAGGKWRLSYSSFTGHSSNLEVDLNFMFRQPLWAIRPVDSYYMFDTSHSPR